MTVVNQKSKTGSKKKKSVAKFDLFFDESGDFMETSSNSTEVKKSQTHKHRAASQYVGLLAKRGSLDSTKASKILEDLKKLTGIELSHATDIRNKKRYANLVSEAIDKIKNMGWQPVRLVNKERVQFGDRASTHLTLAAELVVRIFMQKQREGVERINICVVPAGVKLGTNANDSPILLNSEDYEPRLREAIGYVSVRKGQAYQSSNWIVDRFRLGSGRRWPELILCDLLSNASFANFRRLEPALKTKLQNAFGDYDFSLSSYDLLERVEFLRQEGLFGNAMSVLSEAIVGGDENDPATNLAQQKLAEVLELVSSLPSRTRDPHLNQLVIWLEHIIGGQRNDVVGLRLIDWISKNIAKPLEQNLGAQKIAWFHFALAFWGLTACNHSGNLAHGANFAARLKKLSNNLMANWEHSDLLTRGMIAIGVHQNDGREFDLTASSMETIVECDRTISKMYVHDLFDTQDQPIVHSDLRAQALGTWVQAEIHAGLADPCRLKSARQLSDQAIQEFTDDSDRYRQYQYRSHLETASGNFDAAVNFLAKSLSCSPTHEEICTAICELNDLNPNAEAFAMLHWFRLGSSLLWNQHADSELFLVQFNRLQQFNSPWLDGSQRRFPAHGISRRLAVIKALEGQFEEATKALNLLVSQMGSRGLPLELIRIAAISEVGCVFWRDDQTRKARELFNHAIERIEAALARLGDNRQIKLRVLLEQWYCELQTILLNEQLQASDFAAIRSLARKIEN